MSDGKKKRGRPRKDASEVSPKKPAKDPFDNNLTKIANKVIGDGGATQRSTEDLFAKAEVLGVDPFEILLLIADGNAHALSLEDGKSVSPELRAMAARECMRYMYPTLKQAQLIGDKDNPISVKHDLVDRLFEALS